MPSGLQQKAFGLPWIAPCIRSSKTLQRFGGRQRAASIPRRSEGARVGNLFQWSSLVQAWPGFGHLGFGRRAAGRVARLLGPRSAHRYPKPAIGAPATLGRRHAACYGASCQWSVFSLRRMALVSGYPVPGRPCRAAGFRCRPAVRGQEDGRYNSMQIPTWIAGYSFTKGREGI